MSLDDDRELIELEDGFSDEVDFEENDFEENDFEELGGHEGDLEEISAYEVGTTGELEDPSDEYEIDEPWQADLEELDDESDELEFESGFDDELDEEGFFSFIKKIGRGLGSLVKKGARALGRIVGPLFKKLAPIAARIVGGAIGGPAGAAIGGTIAGAVLRESEMETEAGTEAEFEQSEIDFEEAGGDSESYEAMQGYAEIMAGADSERRVNRAFVALARRIPRMFRRNRRLQPVIPLVIRASLALAKTFRKNRRTRWAIRAIPLIIRRTLTRLARARRIDRRAVVLAMSRETAWVLANPRRARLSMRRGVSRRRPRRAVRPHRTMRRRRSPAMREELFY